ncbi:MAG: GMC family oxidoreductase N-terminal domain-containing protein, partial [Acidobacteria bacterium]|nr:GMC family oxidoreductase N-terminal domain-containing protein [Acidobacteriota bacterium]
MAEKSYDLAVVGAGQAGCTLAGIIASKGVHPKTGEPLKMAIFDRGPYFKGKPRPGYGAVERRRMFTNITSEFRERYVVQTGLPPGQRRKVPLAPTDEIFTQGTAAIFGGGTLHYTARTIAPFEVDYGVWVDETGADWSYQNMKPFADQITRDLHIHSRPEAELTRLDKLYRDAAKAMGYAPVDCTIAKRNCLVTGYCDGANMCRYDARQGSFIAYLPLAEERGADMFPECRVGKILIEKVGASARVRGVEYVQAGVRRTLEVPRVIVSCGNYGTAPLLYRSGYGPRELTDGAPIVENRNVGRNTDNRPQVSGPSAIFDEPVSDGQFHHETAYFVYHDLHADRRYERVQIGLEAERVPYPEQIAVGAAAPAFGREHKEFMRDVCRPEKMTRARAEFARRAKSVMNLVRPRNIHGWINEWGEQIYAGNDPAIIKPLEQGREVIYELFKKMG